MRDADPFLHFAVTKDLNEPCVTRDPNVAIRPVTTGQP